MTISKAEKARREADKANCCDQLRAMLKPGATVYTVTHGNVGRGLTRRVQCFISVCEPDRPATIRDITHLVAGATGLRLPDWRGITMSGGGYSKPFEVVYRLGHALWPNGTPEPHGMRNGEPDRDGGYALRQVSL